MSTRLPAGKTVAVWAVVIAVALGLRYIGVKANEAGRGGLALAVVLGVIALVLLILMIPVIRDVRKVRIGPMTPARRLMISQLDEKTTLRCPAFYLGPQPVGSDGAPMTDRVLLVVTRQTVSVRPAEAEVGYVAGGTVLCDADGARVRPRLLPCSRAGGRWPGRMVPGLVIAHPSLLYPQAVGSLEAERYWVDGPDELDAYAREIAAETGLLYEDVADALLRGDPRSVAALNAACGGYLGEMVLSSRGPVFRAPEMRLVIADPDRPDDPADEAVIAKVMIAVQQALPGPGASGPPPGWAVPPPDRGGSLR